MFEDIRFFTDDIVWRGILTDLGAESVPENNADVVVTGFEKPLTPMELKARLIAAIDARGTEIIRNVFGRDVNLAPASRKIITILYHAGSAGAAAEDLRAAFGYSATANTHAVETAISNLRREFGTDFIVFEGGGYKLRRGQ